MLEWPDIMDDVPILSEEHIVDITTYILVFFAGIFQLKRAIQKASNVPRHHPSRWQSILTKILI